MSTTVPLVGPEMSTVFVFRRFKQLGVDATVAGWALVLAGVVSSLASGLLFVVGAVLSGNEVVAAGAAGGAVGLGLALATVAIRCPGVLGRYTDRWAGRYDRPDACSAGPLRTETPSWASWSPGWVHCAFHPRVG